MAASTVTQRRSRRLARRDRQRYGCLDSLTITAGTYDRRATCCGLRYRGLSTAPDSMRRRRSTHDGRARHLDTNREGSAASYPGHRRGLGACPISTSSTDAAAHRLGTDAVVQVGGRTTTTLTSLDAGGRRHGRPLPRATLERRPSPVGSVSEASDVDDRRASAAARLAEVAAAINTVQRTASAPPPSAWTTTPVADSSSPATNDRRRRARSSLDTSAVQSDARRLHRDPPRSSNAEAHHRRTGAGAYTVESSEQLVQRTCWAGTTIAVSSRSRHPAR